MYTVEFNVCSLVTEENEGIHTTRQSLSVEKDEVFYQNHVFRFLNANKNVEMVCPLRKITPQTTASPNRDENTHGSHSAAELVLFFCFLFFR